jgi:hypothetical protein
MFKIKRYSPLKAFMVASLLAGSIYSASPVLAGQKHSKNQSKLEKKVVNESQEESLQFEGIDAEEGLSEEEEYKRELVKQYPTIKDMKKEISISNKIIEKNKQNLHLYGILAGSSLANLLVNALGTNHNDFIPSLNLISLFGCAIGGTINASQKKGVEDEIKYLKGLIKECEEKEPPIEPSELYKE